jgi:hypothetical protein
MVRNIFEPNGNDQYSLIRPFLDEVAAREAQAEDNPDTYATFFMKEVDQAIHTVRDKESIPGWVLNLDEYRMKSEILISMKLLEEMIQRDDAPIPEENIYSEGSEGFLEQFSEEMPHEAVNDEPELTIFPVLIAVLYIRMRQFGEERGWDMKIFHWQLLKVLGFEIGSNMMAQLLPRENVGIDYN